MVRYPGKIESLEDWQIGFVFSGRVVCKMARFFRKAFEGKGLRLFCLYCHWVCCVYFVEETGDRSQKTEAKGENMEGVGGGAHKKGLRGVGSQPF